MIQTMVFIFCKKMYEIFKLHQLKRKQLLLYTSINKIQVIVVLILLKK